MSASVVTIDDFTSFMAILKPFWEKVDKHSHIRLWYRGHANASWELKPGVYRESFNVRDEIERLEKEQQLSQDFRVRSAGLLKWNLKDEELYFLQQHYKMPTRLLDWSYSPVTALFFTVCDSTDQDGAFFMMDAYDLAITQDVYDRNPGFKGTPTSTFPGYLAASKVISHWGKVQDFPNFILPVRPAFSDPRITLQNSCFTFHVPAHPELTVNENKSLLKYIVPKEKKLGIMRELSLLGVNAFTTFGDLESLSSMLKNSHNVSD